MNSKQLNYIWFFRKKNDWIPASAGMTKKHALKNVILRLDRGIQGFFNLNTKDNY
jgi:hypothetical protein